MFRKGLSIRVFLEQREATIHNLKSKCISKDMQDSKMSYHGFGQSVIPAEQIHNKKAAAFCSWITDLLARSQWQISPTGAYTFPAHTMSCLFEEHKKGCKDHSPHPVGC